MSSNRRPRSRRGGSLHGGRPWPSPPLEVAFRQAIVEQPGDDAHRLVYADWLDEHGDWADRLRAEFIRTQIELAGCGGCSAATGDWGSVTGRCTHCRLLTHATRLANTPEPGDGAGGDTVPVATQAATFSEVATAVADGYSPLRQARLAEPGTLPRLAWHVWCGRDGFAPLLGGVLTWRSGLLVKPAEAALDNTSVEAYFTRGFLGRVGCPVRDWLANGPAVTRMHPVGWVSLTDVCWHSSPAGSGNLWHLPTAQLPPRLRGVFLDLTRPGWRSRTATGLPGRVWTVDFPEEYDLRLALATACLRLATHANERIRARQRLVAGTTA